MVSFRFRSRSSGDTADSSGRITGPITLRSRKQRIFMGLFFGVFAAAGGGMLYPLGIRPIGKTLDADSWVEVGCRIISAEVESHEGDDSTTYSINISYEYEYEGRMYKSDRYDFVGWSSSGYSGKAKVVEGYRRPSNPVCFVNPERPSEAVLRRGFHWGLLLALFPLPFLAAGVGGLIWVIRGPSRGKPQSTTEQWLPESKAEPLAGPGFTGDMASGSVVLKPSSGPWVKVIFAVVFAGFWNGIIWLAAMPNVIESWREGGGWFSGMFLLFMIPFLLVGVGMIVLVFYLVLAAFNPRPTLTLSNRTIPLGGSARLRWNITGNAGRIQNLKLLLRGAEEATYRQGTRSYTDKNTFYQGELYSLEQSMTVGGGKTVIEVPSDTMHSFAARNNKIVWRIAVHGSIATWPDMHEEFEITVTPAGAGRR